MTLLATRHVPKSNKNHLFVLMKRKVKIQKQLFGRINQLFESPKGNHSNPATPLRQLNPNNDVLMPTSTHAKTNTVTQTRVVGKIFNTFIIYANR